jgi:hypothetical protein
MKRFKVAVWYPPKKKFITLESDISHKEAMYRSYAFKNNDLKVFVMQKGKKLRKIY